MSKRITQHQVSPTLQDINLHVSVGWLQRQRHGPTSLCLQEQKHTSPRHTQILNELQRPDCRDRTVVFMAVLPWICNYFICMWRGTEGGWSVLLSLWQADICSEHEEEWESSSNRRKRANAANSCYLFCFHSVHKLVWIKNPLHILAFSQL